MTLDGRANCKCDRRYGALARSKRQCATLKVKAPAPDERAGSPPKQRPASAGNPPLIFTPAQRPRRDRETNGTIARNTPGTIKAQRRDTFSDLGPHI